VVLFAVTLVLVIVQPRGLSIGWSAAGGAVLALLLGVDRLGDVAVVWGIVGNATITFVAVILISMVLDRVGFFEWAAVHMLLVARGDGRRALWLVLALGAIVAAFFANDGAALILTPIVYQQIRSLGFSPREALPFVMAAGFIADTTSLPLVVSNLVNIVSATFFHLGFLTYATVMVPVDLVSFGASVLVLFLFYRRSIPARYDPAALESPARAIRDPQLFRAGWVVLGVLFAGYLASEPLRIPVAIPASIAAAILLVLARRSPALSSAALLREAPWRIVIFSLGMYLVVYGLENAGLTHYLAELLAGAARDGLLAASVVGGAATAMLSAAMNNMPTTLIAALAVHAARLHGSLQQALVYADVVGADLGPKFTPIGSLATLLWLHVLDTKGVRISWRSYVRQGIVLTTPVLLATLASVAGWVYLVR
jgi:arsenical pump membrane protein